MVFGVFQKRSLKQFGRIVVLTSIVVTGTVAAARQWGALESAELAAYDQFMQLKPAEPTDERVLVVGISEEDIQTRQEYPLEDGTLADLLMKLEEHNPRAIGIDILRDVPQGPEIGRDRLTSILANSDRIASACILSSFGDPGAPAAPGTAPDFIGFADLPQDVDGRVRRTILISAPAPAPVQVGETHLCNDAAPENEVLSLSLLLSLIYLEQENVFLEQNLWGELMLGETVFKPLGDRTGGYAYTGAADYQVMLNYRAAENAVRMVSLTDVLEDSVDPSWIRNRVVLIGYTSQVANDVLLTPYRETTAGFREMPGVLIHAQATSQILSAVLDDRHLTQSWPELAELAWIGLAAVAGGSVALYSSRRVGIFVLGCSGLMTAYWGVCLGLFIQGFWLPLVPSVFAFMLSAGGVLMVDRASQGGYAQAIYEQIKDQLWGHHRSAQKFDYLEDLVHRARVIRQCRKGKALLNEVELSEANGEGVQVQFESPDLQMLYEDIKTRAQKDWERERTVIEAEQQQQQIDAQAKRINTLLYKSKVARGEISERSKNE